ncbi:MAG: hypothetical protein ACQZ3M_01325, partial [cyanobacterium endosymbiont of Rhopalodia fuxianensis]
MFNIKLNKLLARYKATFFQLLLKLIKKILDHEYSQFVKIIGMLITSQHSKKSQKKRRDKKSPHYD